MGKATNQVAVNFVILFGVISLFADMTYESARSITGPYLATLGASATIVGIVAGFGELIGYGLRVVSGIICDRSNRYWAVILVGYAINLLAVPALALAGSWELAATLVVAERFGKAIRTPARDAMLSHVTYGIGRGWGFGIHEAMDQIGAIIGPIIIASIIAWKGSYKYGFAVLAVPSLLALSVLIVARFTNPHPSNLEPSFNVSKTPGTRKMFLLYLIAIVFVALGFIDYPLAAFHMKNKSIFNDKWIPLIYAGAMGVDALSALVFGRLYDRKKFPVVLAMIAVSAWCAPLIFLFGPSMLILGAGLWGVGMGAQESIIRAVIADIISRRRRASGYGIFNACFGLAWFAGSTLMGILYKHSLIVLVVFSTVTQSASLPLLYFVYKRLLSQDSC